jgi:protein TonB
VVVAVMLHALIIFGIQFVPPRATSAPVMEVTWVPTQSKSAPVQADFVAQAAQQGSGQLADARLTTTTQRSPTPGVAEQRQQSSQRTQPQSATPVVSVSGNEQTSRLAEPQQVALTANANDEQDQVAQEIALLEARLAARRQTEAKRPRVHTVSSVSARADDWAGYVEQFRERVEMTGNQQLMAEVRASQLRGEVRLMVALTASGRLQELRVLRSSGHRLLDEAAQQSVRDSLPFAEFPSNLKSQVDVLQVVRTWRFSDRLETSQ